MMVTKFQMDAMSRADIAEKEREDFYLYVDEFQNFATDSFATILSEARKYKLNLVMANQYIDQMQESVKGAVF
jgi:type IV secretory pathway TraG/TraD family ATPase VirD4